MNLIDYSVTEKFDLVTQDMLERIESMNVSPDLYSQIVCEENEIKSNYETTGKLYRNPKFISEEAGMTTAIIEQVYTEFEEEFGLEQVDLEDVNKEVIRRLDSFLLTILNGSEYSVKEKFLYSGIVGIAKASHELWIDENPIMQRNRKEETQRVDAQAFAYKMRRYADLGINIFDPGNEPHLHTTINHSYCQSVKAYFIDYPSLFNH
ncbi:MAG: hypothetical protein ACEPOW_08330 [Bacteroidales bacterium]